MGGGGFVEIVVPIVVSIFVNPHRCPDPCRDLRRLGYPVGEEGCAKGRCEAENCGEDAATCYSPEANEGLCESVDVGHDRPLGRREIDKRSLPF